MTVKTFKYEIKTRNQKANPFLDMGKAKWDYQKELIQRQCFIHQLQTSRDQHDQDVYNALVEIRDAMFGRSLRHQQSNTGASALAGAIEKIYDGDISLKQVRNIQPVLVVLAREYPDLWSEIAYKDISEQTASDTSFDQLFEIT